MESAIWPSIAHLSKQAYNTSPLFSVVVVFGVGFAGNGAVDTYVLLFSVLVIVGVVSAGNIAVGAYEVKLSADLM